MNVNTKIKSDIETNTEIKNNVITEEEANILSNPDMPFSNVLSGINQGNESIINTSNCFDYDIDSISLNFDDAMFFVNLAQEGQFSVATSQTGEFQSILQTEITQNIVSQRTVEVTNKITELIEKAQSTQKPVRISFDNDVSVVLKIDKNGKITAEFIPGSIEVENYLRNNIAALRQRFDEQNLPYNDLLYRQNSKQNRNKDKEKGDN